MGEYEPHDSRIVTNNPSNTPIEPDRTGPKEGETRGDAEPSAPTQVDPAEGARDDAGKDGEKDRWQVDERPSEPEGQAR